MNLSKKYNAIEKLVKNRVCLATNFSHFVSFLLKKSQFLFFLLPNNFLHFYLTKNSNLISPLYHINHFLLLFKQKTFNKTLYQTGFIVLEISKHEGKIFKTSITPLAILKNVPKFRGSGT
jgi:hypothetical protein